MRSNWRCFASSILTVHVVSAMLVNPSDYHMLHGEEIMTNGHNNIEDSATIRDEDPVPLSTREHWMRRAKDALYELTGTPCPNQAFGTAIVNHTNRADDDLGDLVCIGANQMIETGNPTLHGEIAAINNCTVVLGLPPYNLSPSEITEAWKDLSLYTTCEACSMCSSAIGWAYFREYVYGTSLWNQRSFGWDEIALGSRELLGRSGKDIRIVGPLLEAETDPLFKWQFQDGDCPQGCVKGSEGQPRCVFEKEAERFEL